MPWQCFIGESFDKRVGAMWPVTDAETHKEKWFVRLPDGGFHNIHAVSLDGTPWDVSGEAPNFTVSPSINRHPTPGTKHKGWHGWIRNGIITDDCEGRRYD